VGEYKPGQPKQSAASGSAHGGKHAQKELEVIAKESKGEDLH
jgi:hypothetical protein